MKMFLRVNLVDPMDEIFHKLVKQRRDETQIFSSRSLIKSYRPPISRFHLEDLTDQKSQEDGHKKM